MFLQEEAREDHARREDLRLATVGVVGWVSGFVLGLSSTGLQWLSIVSYHDDDTMRQSRHT